MEWEYINTKRQLVADDDNGVPQLSVHFTLQKLLSNCL